MFTHCGADYKSKPQSMYTKIKVKDYNSGQVHTNRLIRYGVMPITAYNDEYAKYYYVHTSFYSEFLQNDLHMLEKATEEEIKRTRTEAEKQEAADSKNSEGKKEKLTAELNELKAKQDNLTSEHREVEQNLRQVRC